MAIYGIRKKRERLSLLRSDECHPSVKKKQKIDTVVKIAALGGGGGRNGPALTRVASASASYFFRLLTTLTTVRSMSTMLSFYERSLVYWI